MAKATYKQIVYLGFWFQRIRVDGGESMAEAGLTPAYLQAPNTSRRPRSRDGERLLTSRSTLLRDSPITPPVTPPTQQSHTF